MGYDASLFTIINLARENDILHILPAAFYTICTSLNGKEFRGYGEPGCANP
jgi:hypothetical protein